MNFLARPFLLIFLFSVALVSCKEEVKEVAQEAEEESATTLPNIVFILVDDLGMISTPLYSQGTPFSTGEVYDEQGNSATYQTLAMDSIAQTGMLFTQMYSTPLCAPSRGELVTGRYPARTGMVYPGYMACDSALVSDTSNVYGYLGFRFETYANMLQDNGYQTAFGGKWNLRFGHANFCFDRSSNYDQLVSAQQEHLERHGFDEAFGPNALLGAMVDYRPSHMDYGYFPDTLNAWVLNYLRTVDQSKPFYMHYCMGLIHDASDGKDGQCVNMGPPGTANATNAQKFADKLTYADGLIDSVWRVLEEEDLLDNTMLIIAGDNGTEFTYYSNYQGDTVQGGKNSLAAHGSHVPFMISWPNVVDSNSTNLGLTSFADIFATLQELCTPGTTNPNIDGISFLAELTNGTYGTPNAGREYVYCQYKNNAFVSNGDYELVINQLNTSTGAPIYMNGGNGLYSLANAPQEYLYQDTTGSPALKAIYDSLYAYYLDTLGIDFQTTPKWVNNPDQTYDFDPSGLNCEGCKSMKDSCLTYF